MKTNVSIEINGVMSSGGADQLAIMIGWAAVIFSLLAGAAIYRRVKQR